MCIPNSIQTVIPNKNDLIYFRENSNLDLVEQKVARLNQGYYSVETLATEIARAMTDVSFLPEEYVVNYNTRLGRYEFSNPSQRFGFSFLIYSKETQEIGELKILTLFHGFRKMEMALGVYWAWCQTQIYSFSATKI